MQFTVTASGHTLLASFVPPAEAVCDIVCSVCGFVRGAGADQVGEPVVICAAGTTRFRSFQVAETTPGDADVVALAFDVEVAVTAVLEIAMVHPHVLCAVEAQVVPTVAVVRSGTFERQVAQQQVTALQIQDTGLVFVLLFGNQFLARQRHDRQVTLVRADVIGDGDVLRNDDDAVFCV